MLRALPIQTCWDDPPADAGQLIRTAAQWEDDFLARRAVTPVLSFHSSNFAMVHHALSESVARGWAPASGTLIEWGSGLGVVSCLWSLLGGRSFGIEADAELVELANQLAQTRQLDARFAGGNFMPQDSWQLVDPLDDTTRLVRDGGDGHALLGIQPQDADIIFVYPWPGERRLIDDVFEHFAKPHALLMSFHGGDELRVQRKEPK